MSNMLKYKIIPLAILLVSFVSCAKKTALEETINCSNSSFNSDLKQFTDVNKNYKISIPNNWKVQKYYDNFQSDIFAADTLKQLTETYILDTSFKTGELELNDEFGLKIKNSTSDEIVASKFEVINDKFVFWHLTKGIKNNYDHHELILYFKTSADTYLQVSVEIYGSKLVDERLCEAVNIIKTIDFI